MSSLMKYTKILRRFFSAMTFLTTLLTAVSVASTLAGILLTVFPEAVPEAALGGIGTKAAADGAGWIISFLLWRSISVLAGKFFSEAERSVCPFTPASGDILHGISVLFAALSFIPQNVTALIAWLFSHTPYSVWPVKAGYLALTFLFLFLEKVFCYGVKIEALRYFDHEEWYREKTN